MIKPATWTTREEALLLINAYVDGELDAAAVLDVEKRMASDASLRAEYEQLLQLRSKLAGHLQIERATDDLRQRIAAIPSRPRRVPRPFVGLDTGWMRLAAAVVLSAAIASSLTYVLVHPAANADLLSAMVSGHRRALLAATPFDIASSDRHTVKPWMDAKLALSPPIIDLAAKGFPLVGGRVEVVDDRPVPALVYMRRGHLISVVAVPHHAAGRMSDVPQKDMRDGYTTISWEGTNFRLFAISDLAQPELAEFVTLWRAEAG
jgi:anti-sigma factor RsiW